MSKDEFLLPNIDMLIDATVGHSMFYFIDGFNGYNQIMMEPYEVDKIALWTRMGNFCYKSCHLVLKMQVPLTSAP